MKVCFLTVGFSNYGGVGRATAVLASCLAARPDLSVYTLCLWRDPQDNGYALSDAVHKDFLFEEKINIRRALLRGAMRRLRTYLKEKKIDVLVACGTLYYPLAVLACRHLPTRCVLWEHTHPNSRGDHFLQDESRAYGARRSDANVLIAARAKEIYDARFGKANNLVIHNPLDPAAACRREPYGKINKRILSVGRLSYPKNYELLIRIAGRVLAGYDDWCWDIYGEGELRASLEEAIQKEGLEGRVRLMGQCNSVYEIYPDYDLFVMTSRLEGFPMVLLEASANALPLVAFDIETGPNEIIRHGENGFLLPAGEEEAMIDAIRCLLADADLRKRMSQESERTAAAFSADAAALAWCALFEKLMHQ